MAGTLIAEPSPQTALYPLYHVLVHYPYFYLPYGMQAAQRQHLWALLLCTNPKLGSILVTP